MIKRVTIEILHPTTHKVIRNFSINPPRSQDGQRQSFTQKGVDSVLEKVIEAFDKSNPDHKYHLVPLGRGKFRFVWREEADDDTSTSAS